MLGCRRRPTLREKPATPRATPPQLLLIGRRPCPDPPRVTTIKTPRQTRHRRIGHPIFPSWIPPLRMIPAPSPRPIRPRQRLDNPLYEPTSRTTVAEIIASSGYSSLQPLSCFSTKPS